MGRLEATDRTGKTVEAWWALLFAEGSLGQSVIRWAWPVIGGAIGAWVASATDWISSYGVAGWAATIMLGALGTVWIAVGIDHFRSRRSREVDASLAPESYYQPETLGRDKLVTEAEIKALVRPLIDARFAELTKTEIASVFATHAQMHSHDEMLADLADKLKFVRGLAETAGELAAGSEDQIKALKRNLDDWTHQHNQSQERRFLWVDGGFRAILDRERLTHYAERLVGHADFLLSPRKGRRIENWVEWENRRAIWQADLDAWLELAAIHRVGADARVRGVKSYRLEGKWAEDEFIQASHDTIVAYRWVAATHDNFMEERGHVERAVASAAFARPSMKGNPSAFKDEDQ